MEEDDWIIWNGAHGVFDRVTLGELEDGQAWLEEPYDMVGPFDLDELLTSGRIHFAACIVMTQARWQLDQQQLRRNSMRQRRAADERRSRRQSYYNQRNATPPHIEHEHRHHLGLPKDGKLQVTQIKAAYRRLAQKAHPDTGGDAELFVKITQARDALLKIAS